MMAKRFTDTNKYKKPFYRALKGPYKLFWDFLYHECDHAGIWIVDFEIAQLYIGHDMIIDQAEALRLFNSGETRIIEFDEKTRWFIPSFVDFQYGELNETNRAHQSILKLLTKYDLTKYIAISPLQAPSQGAMDKDMDMVKEIGIREDFFATFLNFLHYKRKRGESYKTKESTAQAYKRLLDLSGSDPVVAVEIVNQTLANNWQGLFALKDKPKQSMEEVISYNMLLKRFQEGETDIWDKYEAFKKDGRNLWRRKSITALAQ